MSDFLLHLVSRSVLMVFASFLLFVPSLMTQVYGTSSAVAARVGSLYAMGCLLSVSTMSKTYARLRRRGKLWMVTLLLLFGATGSSIAQLGHVATWWTISPWTSATTFFLWGFSFAVPFTFLRRSTHCQKVGKNRQRPLPTYSMLVVSDCLRLLMDW